MDQDPRYNEALRIVQDSRYSPSISRLIGEMKIGYSRAAAIFDHLKREGVVKWDQEKMDYRKVTKE